MKSGKFPILASVKFNILLCNRSVSFKICRGLINKRCYVVNVCYGMTKMRNVFLSSSTSVKNNKEMTMHNEHDVFIDAIHTKKN